MKIINATDHDCHLLDDSGKVIKVFKKSNILIRLLVDIEKVGSIDSVPITRTIFTVPKLPKYKLGIYYIVSSKIKNALPERKDFLVPAELVRDRSNNIIGCKSIGI